jgi:uncharacterized protein (TIGR02996 family)
MTDHDALLRAIIDNPEEDTPRLAFADWLDEHADAFPTPAAVRQRAAFIRDDTVLSQRDEFDPARLRWELIEKPACEAEPWTDHALPPLPEGYAFGRDPLFRRGFPWAVELSPLGRVGRHELLPGTFPPECIRLRDLGYQAVTILHNSPWRNRVSAVEFHPGPTGRVGVRRLVQVPNLDCLTRLTFGDPAFVAPYAINAPETRELIESPLFGRLSSLGISRAPVGTALALAIARIDATALRELRLTACQLRSEALAALLESPTGVHLESLSIGHDVNSRPGKLQVLGRATRPRALRSLVMNLDLVNEAGLEAFLASPLVSTLNRLDLSHCGLNRERMRLLASGEYENLRVLKLNGNPIGNDGADSLARSTHLAKLLVLELSYSQVGDEGIEAILESPLADGLVLLDLTGSPASDEVKELLKARMGDRVRV